MPPPTVDTMQAGHAGHGSFGAGNPHSSFGSGPGAPVSGPFGPAGYSDDGGRFGGSGMPPRQPGSGLATVSMLSDGTAMSGINPKRMREMPSDGSSLMGGPSFASPRHAFQGDASVSGSLGPGGDTGMYAAPAGRVMHMQRCETAAHILADTVRGGPSSAMGGWIYVPAHLTSKLATIRSVLNSEALELSNAELLGVVASAIQAPDTAARFYGQAASRGPADGPQQGAAHFRAGDTAALADGSHESVFSSSDGHGQGRLAGSGRYLPTPRTPHDMAHTPSYETVRPTPGGGGQGAPASGWSDSMPLPMSGPIGMGSFGRRTTPPTMTRQLGAPQSGMPGAGGAPPLGSAAAAANFRKRPREHHGGQSSSSSSASAGAGAAAGAGRSSAAMDAAAARGLHALKHAADDLESQRDGDGGDGDDDSDVHSPTAAGSTDTPMSLPAGAAGSRVTSRMRRALVMDQRVAEGSRTGTVSSKDGVSWGRVNNPVLYVEHSGLPASWPAIPFPRDYLMTNLPPDDGRTGRLTRAAVVSLREWMTEGRTWLSPYPTQQDIAMLSERTGMSAKQLRDWFRNERKRVWLPFWQSRLSNPECQWAVQRSSGARANIIPKSVIERFAHHSTDLDLNTAVTLELEGEAGAGAAVAAGAASGSSPEAKPHVVPRAGGGAA